MQLRKLFFNVLYFFGLGTALAFINRKKSKSPILLFHRVSPEYDPYTEPYHPRDFEKIILFLKSKYHLRPIKDLFKLDPSALKGSAFVVFDDGFKDFYDWAFPIIQKHQVPVTLFIPSFYVDKPTTIWNNEFFSYFLGAQRSTLEISIAGKRKQFALSKDHEKNYNTVMTLHHQLLLLEPFRRQEMMKAIYTRLKPLKINYFPLMTWDMLRTVKASPLVDIQSHTETHPYLPSLHAETEISGELNNSRKKLEKELNTEIDSIAYPVGGYNAKTLELVPLYYNYGFTVGERLVDLKKLQQKSYNLVIPRFNITDKSCPELFFRINGFHKSISNILRELKSR